MQNDKPPRRRAAVAAEQRLHTEIVPQLVVAEAELRQEQKQKQAVVKSREREKMPPSGVKEATCKQAANTMAKPALDQPAGDLRQSVKRVRSAVGQEKRNATQKRYYRKQKDQKNTIEHTLIQKQDELKRTVTEFNTQKMEIASLEAERDAGPSYKMLSIPNGLAALKATNRQPDAVCPPKAKPRNRYASKEERETASQAFHAAAQARHRAKQVEQEKANQLELETLDRELSQIEGFISIQAERIQELLKKPKVTSSSPVRRSSPVPRPRRRRYLASEQLPEGSRSPSPELLASTSYLEDAFPDIEFTLALPRREVHATAACRSIVPG